jgi:hypothetical protein
VVLKALQKDPVARYQTADEMRADLEQTVGGVARRTIAVVSVPVQPGPVQGSRPPRAEVDAAERTARLPVHKEARPMRQEQGRRSGRRRALVAGAVLFPVALLVAAMIESTSARPAAHAPSTQPNASGVTATTEQISTIPAEGTAEVVAAVPPTAEPALPTPTAAPPVPPVAPAGGAASAPPPPATPQLSAGADSPVTAVTGFYQLVGDHRFGEAATLWSPRMLASYPPTENITGRFARTRSLQVVKADVVRLDERGGRAVVAVDVREATGPSTARWVGNWYLVRGTRGWLLDQPELRAG